MAAGSTPGAPWTSSTLPSTPAIHPGTLLLCAATSADDPCGWAGPSADEPGTTPFDYVVRPPDITPTHLFPVGAAATTSKTPQRTDDLAYCAVHCALPSSASVSTIANPGSSCRGSAG